MSLTFQAVGILALLLLILEACLLDVHLKNPFAEECLII